jgi:hypothetical protein
LSVTHRIKRLPRGEIQVFPSTRRKVFRGALLRQRRVEEARTGKPRDVVTADIVAAITRSMWVNTDLAFRIGDNEKITVRSVIPHGEWQQRWGTEIPLTPVVEMMQDHLSGMAVNIYQYRNVFEMVLLSNEGFYFAPDRRYNLNNIDLATPNHRLRSLSLGAAGITATLNAIASLWSTGGGASEALYYFCRVVESPRSSYEQKAVACGYRKLFAHAVDHRESLSIFALLE